MKTFDIYQANIWDYFTDKKKIIVWPISVKVQVLRGSAMSPPHAAKGYTLHL